MSQNSHTLLLFINDEQTHKNCLLMFLKLHGDDDEQARVYADRLGVDVTTHWDNDWFNQEVSAQPEYIRLDYDTSTHETLPLEVLKMLFEHGLDAAVLDTFHDQVGEYSRHYFLANQLVNPETLYKDIERARGVVESQINQEDEEDYSVTVEKPITIDQLIRDEQKQSAEAQEMVSAIMDLGKIAKETGSDPMEVVKSALVLRAFGKGLLQAFIFGLVTVLLFKGMWLWIVQALLLAIILPLYYVSQVAKEFDDEEEEVTDAD
jgi:hypothetical protein